MLAVHQISFTASDYRNQYVDPLTSWSPSEASRSNLSKRGREIQQPIIFSIKHSKIDRYGFRGSKSFANLRKFEFIKIVFLFNIFIVRETFLSQFKLLSKPNLENIWIQWKLISQEKITFRSCFSISWSNFHQFPHSFNGVSLESYNKIIRNTRNVT